MLDTIKRAASAAYLTAVAHKLYDTPREEVEKSMNRYIKEAHRAGFRLGVLAGICIYSLIKIIIT